MPLKILLAHNYYQQPGGEDTAFESEVNLLRERGHQVVEYIEHNDRIVKMNKVSVATQTLWSRDSYQKIFTLIEKEKPDLAHFHNTFPLISPAAYYACEKAGIPVIQALDNPRLLCPSANFFRDGKLCQDCLGKTPPWPSLFHACYHASRLQTAAIASMLTFHRWRGTWARQVDCYLVATEFYRHKFIEGGLPAEKIVVKPHFIYTDPSVRSGKQRGEYALFIGRLDPEKGIRVLLEAWKTLRYIPLKIRGDGQLEKEAEEFILSNRLSSVELVQRLSREELTALIRGARFLIWPSEGYYETFGYVAVDCFASGIPVIASDIGVMSEIVKTGVTGLHFTPGDPAALSEKVEWAWGHPDSMSEMGRNARKEYELNYTAERNYDMLMEIYKKAIERANGKLHHNGTNLSE